MTTPTDIERISYGGPKGSLQLGQHREVIQGTATYTLLPKQSGALCIFTQAVTGGIFTLPTPVEGMIFEFVTLVSVTASDVNKVLTAAATHFLIGGVAMASLTAGGNDFFVADGSAHVGISMGATTTGGLKGGWIRLTAISSTLWHIQGVPVGSGTLTDPFI